VLKPSRAGGTGQGRAKGTVGADADLVAVPSRKAKPSLASRLLRVLVLWLTPLARTAADKTCPLPSKVLDAADHAAAGTPLPMKRTLWKNKDCWKRTNTWTQPIGEHESRKPALQVRRWQES